MLGGFDLEIAGGESVALVGPTGCGKSTVARLIPRFYDVTEGSVRIDGHDVRDVRLGSLRREIGLVFEETFLFSDTVWENLAFAARAATSTGTRSSAPRAWLAPTTSSATCPTGTRRCSASTASRSVGSVSGSPSPGPSSPTRACSSSTTPPQQSTTKEHEIRAVGRGDARSHHPDHRPPSATIALADRVVLMDAEGAVVTTGTHTHLLATSAEYRRVLADISDQHDTEVVLVSTSVESERLEPDLQYARHRAPYRGSSARGGQVVAVSLFILAQAGLMTAGPALVSFGIDEGVAKGDTDTVTLAAVLVIRAPRACRLRRCDLRGVEDRERSCSTSAAGCSATSCRCRWFFDRTRTGVLVCRMTADVKRCRTSSARASRCSW